MSSKYSYLYGTLKYTLAYVTRLCFPLFCVRKHKWISNITWTKRGEGEGKRKNLPNSSEGPYAHIYIR